MEKRNIRKNYQKLHKKTPTLERAGNCFDKDQGLEFNPCAGTAVRMQPLFVVAPQSNNPGRY